jgi:hypothetical protein
MQPHGEGLSLHALTMPDWASCGAPPSWWMAFVGPIITSALNAIAAVAIRQRPQTTAEVPKQTRRRRKRR